MKCPKCAEATLRSITVDEIEVDQCTHCRGFWFDRSELGTLLDKDTQRVGRLLGGDDTDDLDYKPGVCPHDKTGMLRVMSARNSKVVLDTCPVCQGIWLDGGEFERIKKHQPDVRLGELV